MRLFSTLSILFVLCLSVQAQYTARSIAEIRENDADGNPLLVDADCEITGIVHSPNFRSSAGLQFVLIDAENVGVTIFSSDYTDYEVKVGDELKIQGTVAVFNGLTEVIPDNVEILSEGNALQEPTEVTALDESTESQLIIIRDVMLVDESDWSGTGSGFNVDMTDGTNNYLVRVDNSTDLYDTEAPTGTFDVIGVGGQFDASAPYDAGYQLLPRSSEDLSVEVDEAEEPTFPKYTIGQVTSNDEEGIPDSLGVTCELEGVVYGVNLRSGNDLQFTIIDENNDGIGIFSPINFGYTVEEGDLISIKGEITFFNGLTQIFPEEINLISMNNPLFDPTPTARLDEDTESQLIQLPCVEIANPEGWSTGSSAFPVVFNEPVSGKGFIVQVDEQTDLHDAPAPEGLVRITGIGWQNDNNPPHDDNYSIMPRYIADIEACTVNTEELLAADAVILYPNPVKDVLQIETQADVEAISIQNIAGKQILNVTVEAYQVDTSKLPKGMYSITVKTSAGVWVSKFIK